MDTETWANAHRIQWVYAGSRLYGTACEDSDWDERGVCLMPPEALLGLTEFESYQVNTKDRDIAIYGLTKFFKMCIQANPNIFDVLCAPPETWQMDTGYWWEIYNNRQVFYSNRVRHTFNGYARQQLSRLQGHFRWLTNPPSAKPELESYGGRLEKDGKGGQRAVFDNDRETYERDLRDWYSYQKWLNERNPERAKKEIKYGYDLKHAAHTVRPMLKVITFLETGEYNPVLTERERNIILPILNGAWPYEELEAWVKHYDREIKLMPSCLPEQPDFEKAQELLMELNLTSLSDR